VNTLIIQIDTKLLSPKQPHLSLSQEPGSQASLFPGIIDEWYWWEGCFGAWGLESRLS